VLIERADEPLFVQVQLCGWIVV